MGVGHPSEIVNLPEDDSKGCPPTSANNYGTPNTDLHMNLSPNRHIKVYADKEIDGWRYQAFVTNTATGQLQFLEARHRAHARVEDRIRHAKDTGLGRLPSREFALNQAWPGAVMLAADLVAWTRMLACTGDAAVRALWESTPVGYRVVHVAGRLTRSGRRRRVKVPGRWPWAVAIVAGFSALAAIPKRA